MKRMNRKEKIQACIEFFNTIAGLLSETHEVVGSCNQDISQYLIPFGSIQDLSYASKPANSFRISDHWNWYSNLMKNPDTHYIQCFSVDAPWANSRKTPTGASEPVNIIQVGYFGPDNRYHAVFGEVFNRKTHNWSWIEPSAKTVLANLNLLQSCA